MCVYNAPWISNHFNPAPMSKIDDGFNDITFQTAERSRCQLATALISLDNGEYFNKNGTMKNSVGIEYVKATEWSINPERKGPVPENLNYQLPAGTETHANEIFSIDGESYPAQNIKAKVLNKVLSVYC